MKKKQNKRGQCIHPTLLRDFERTYEMFCNEVKRIGLGLIKKEIVFNSPVRQARFVITEMQKMYELDRKEAKNVKNIKKN